MRPLYHLVPTLLATLALSACGDGGGGGPGDATGDAPAAPPGALGEACTDAGDCLSGVCLHSAWATPFCSRPCDSEQEPCAAGADAEPGDTLCVGLEDLPNPAAPPFEGDLTRFCVPTCQDVRECAGLHPGWEICDVPRYLGDPLYPSLGLNKRVCQSPSFHGKEPVDPVTCDWQGTVGTFGNEANLCVKYCAYLATCKERPAGSSDACCEWGCFNRMVVAGEPQDPWRDEVKCYVDTHGAFRQTTRVCSEPRDQCGGVPADPTPPGSG